MIVRWPIGAKPARLSRLPKNARQAAEQRGRWAEWLAAAYLLCKGYRLLARRARTPFGEVDIAALKGATLVIIEVKARQNRSAALEAVTHAQRQRLAHAAVRLAARWRMQNRPIRFDIVLIMPRRWPEHLRDAWRNEI